MGHIRTHIRHIRAYLTTASKGPCWKSCRCPPAKLYWTYEDTYRTYKDHMGHVRTHMGHTRTHMGYLRTHMGHIRTHIGHIRTHIGSESTVTTPVRKRERAALSFFQFVILSFFSKQNFWKNKKIKIFPYTDYELTSSVRKRREELLL